jgi:hypothetical protein
MDRHPPVNIEWEEGFQASDDFFAWSCGELLLRHGSSRSAMESQ